MPSNSKREVTVLAHRGTSLLAPENTLPAFEFASQHGAGCLELDVRLTCDNELLVIHDATVDRTTDGCGLVSVQDAEALKKLDAAYHFDQQGGYPYRGKGVCLLTLSDVLARFADMRVNVDIKDNNPVAVDKLARVVADAGAVSRVVVASFHRDVLNYCRHTYPQLTTSACSADVKKFIWYTLIGSSKTREMPVTLFQLPRRYFVVPFESRWFINAVHRAGAEIHFWTVNDAATMARLIDKGADGIVTDRADIAAKVIDEKKSR